MKNPTRHITSLLLAGMATWHTAHAEPESHTFTTSDDVEIHYLTDGDNGSHVVLVHGFTSSAQGNWYNTEIAPLLAENHRVIAIDMRNHGESETVDEGEPGIVRDVLELLDHLDIDRVHMHGYSMGGYTTLAVLAVAPERLITASAGGTGLTEMEDEDFSDFSWEEALVQRVPTVFPIDLTAVDIPVMTLNGSDDRPFVKTVRMTRELDDYTNHILPGYHHMNAMQPGTGYAERLSFFLQVHDGAE